MDDLLDVFADGFATSARLAAAGIARSRIAEAVEDGTVVLLRRGLFALGSVPAHDRDAVRLNGRVTCVTALKGLNLWVTARELHIAAAPGSNAARSAPDHIRVHWKSWPGYEPASRSRDGVGAALLHMLSCVGADDAVVTLDSAVNSGTLTRSDLEALRGDAPASKRPLFDLVDPTAQSGLETRVRLAMRRRRVTMRTQVFIPGVGRVDTLIGDRLVVETDGDRWHGTKAARRVDYRRNLALFRQEYLLLRLDYAQVMDTWEQSEAVLMDCIRRGDHRWSPAQRRRRA